MRQNLISHRFWSSDYGSIFENLILTLFKLRINSKSQNARAMILTKSVNGAELSLTVTMKTDTKVTVKVATLHQSW